MSTVQWCKSHAHISFLSKVIEFCMRQSTWMEYRESLNYQICGDSLWALILCSLFGEFYVSSSSLPLSVPGMVRCWHQTCSSRSVCVSGRPTAERCTTCSSVQTKPLSTAWAATMPSASGASISLGRRSDRVTDLLCVCVCVWVGGGGGIPFSGKIWQGF